MNFPPSSLPRGQNLHFRNYALGGLLLCLLIAAAADSTSFGKWMLQLPALPARCHRPANAIYPRFAIGGKGRGLLVYEKRGRPRQ